MNETHGCHSMNENTASVESREDCRNSHMCDMSQQGGEHSRASMLDLCRSTMEHLTNTGSDQDVDSASQSQDLADSVSCYLSKSSSQLTSSELSNAEGTKSTSLEQVSEELTPSQCDDKASFTIDKSKISAVPTSEQADELRDLDLVVFNQNEFEEGVLNQVNEAMVAQERDRLIKMTEKEMKCLSDDLSSITQELQSTEKVISMLKPEASRSKETARQLRSVMQQRELKLKQVKNVKAKMKSLCERISTELDGSADSRIDENESSNANHLMINEMLSSGRETEQDRMIRLGKMTPFGTVTPADKTKEPKCQPPTLRTDVSLFDEYLCKEQQKSMAKIKSKTKLKSTTKGRTLTSSDKNPVHDVGKKQEQNILKHQIRDESGSSENGVFYNHRKQDQQKQQVSSNVTSSGKEHSVCPKKNGTSLKASHNICDKDQAISSETDDEYMPDEEEWKNEEDDLELDNHKKGAKQRKVKKHKLATSDDEIHVDVSAGVKKTPKKCHRVHRSDDDGSVVAYCKRLKRVAKEKLLKKHQKLAAGEEVSDSDSDIEIGAGFRVPGSIWNKLYRYQKTGVRWLYELHCQQAGGIIGDEMGLGKTIQMIAFLAGLKHSKLQDKGPHSKYYGLGPTIIITPATVMHQWVKEFHTWWPPFRVAILHASGSYTSSHVSLVESIVKSNGILVTGYNALVLKQDLILKYDWHYVILDEGHKIRNPDAKMTVAAKMFRTCHRIILSGSPMQNNLKELWSLFDFVFPGKLGTLPDFMAHFSVPIVQGGYSNATDIQVRTAYKCACVLRDTINPYLLRRMKADVQSSIQLPVKNEQVLFCRLTNHQREVYIEYLQSRECKQILDGKYMVFPGLISLRKICNHPDLCTGGPKVFDPEMYSNEDKSIRYGYWKRSGKMIVVESLLKLWKKQGQRVLLFSQSKQMLDILERFIQDREYTYMRMDGGTSIGSRLSLIEQFNKDNSIFVFLLTTRVGGLGVNLTGANRVIIFDPDWNPSTDTQARERAWRIGQKRQVTIYRLLTTGTIEEKIYHRQIFKQFLTNRVLKDPKQRRFFKSNDLYDLFTLNDDSAGATTETCDIFAGTGSEVKIKLNTKNKPKHHSEKGVKKVNRFDVLHEKTGGTGLEPDDYLPVELHKSAESNADSSTDKQLNKLREMAKILSMKIAGLHEEDKNSPSSVGKDNMSDDEKLKKQKHEFKKQKRKKKDSYLDGQKISYLDSCDVFHQNNEEDVKTSDDYVLEKLFKNKGLHSALHHDKIMMSSAPDYALVESEAERVANEAVRALKRSRSQCFRAHTGIPTWTGQSGIPASRPRFGQKKKLCLPSNDASACSQSPAKKSKVSMEVSHFDGKVAGSSLTATSEVNTMSSDDLLARMKKRNLMLKPEADGHFDDEENASAVMSADLSPDDVELITEIRNTIAFCCSTDGQATTQELLDKFASSVNPKDSAKFKAMLRSICDFEKMNNVGIWKLKPEFR